MMSATLGEGVVSLEQAITEVLASKVAANRRPYYIRALRQNLNNFARGRESLPINDVTHNHVLDWLAAKNGAPSSRRTCINMLAVMFSHAVRVGHITFNPCVRIERPTVDRCPPRILSPAEARRMLRFAYRKMRWRLPQLILGVFAGIRPMEMKRLYWDAIDLERGYVRIDTQVSKIRRRRIVQLDPKAILWLRRCQPQMTRPIGSMSKRWKHLLLRHCGIVWNADLLRHTAASYLLAKHGDAGRVARLLGNSEEILLTVYHELVDPADCRRFWKCGFNQPSRMNEHEPTQKTRNV